MRARGAIQAQPGQSTPPENRSRQVRVRSQIWDASGPPIPSVDEGPHRVGNHPDGVLRFDEAEGHVRSGSKIPMPGKVGPAPDGANA